ncbi:MAG: NlpC/P60 family protein [Colwellia sp.]
MNINQYFTVPYVDGGRDIAVGLDCWGLVRHVFHHEFNGPWLDVFSNSSRYTKNHQDFKKSVPSFKPCSAKAGALACCFINKNNNLIFNHVGICVAENTVLHTASGHGVKSCSVRAFNRLAVVVKYYEWIK